MARWFEKSLMLVFAAMILGACQTTAGPSGFLTSYDGFRPGPKGGVDRIWTPPTVTSPAAFQASIRGYDKVMLDRIWVSLANKEAYDGVDPEEIQALALDFRQEIITALGNRYPLVTEPGPGVMRISIGLTGIESPSRILATTSTLLPVGLGISTVSRMVTGEHTNVGSASLEMVAADAVSGKALFAAIDRRAGSKDLKKILDPTSDAKKAFKWWAGRLRQTLDAARHSG